MTKIAGYDAGGSDAGTITGSRPGGSDEGKFVGYDAGSSYLGKPGNYGSELAWQWDHPTTTTAPNAPPVQNTAPPADSDTGIFKRLTDKAVQFRNYYKDNKYMLVFPDLPCTSVSHQLWI